MSMLPLKVVRSAALKRSPVVHLLGTLALLSSTSRAFPLAVHSSFLPSSSVFAVATPPKSTTFASRTTCRAMSSSSAADTTNAAKTTTSWQEEDPYIWLEDVKSEESLKFAMDNNKKCLEALGDPSSADSTTGTYDRILKVLESDDRIPHVTTLGRDEAGNDILYNFWKDAANPKGLWLSLIPI